ncbi:MAG: TRAP transporter substrate-binding protein DctP [Alphaproteobacteria bacterium]
MNRLCAAFCLAGATLGMTGAHAADPITIKISDHFPANHISPTSITKPWMAQVEQQSNGQIKFQHYPAQQLVKQTDAVAGMQRRIVDISLINPGLFPSEFPLTGVAFLPGGYSSVVEGGKAIRRLLANSAIRNEFEKAGGTAVLIIPFDGFEVFSRERPIHRPEDVRGLRIRTAGEGQVLAVRALGGTPVTIAVPEVYTAIQRGTLDGSLFPYSVAASYRLGEVTKFATIGANTAFSHVVYTANATFWGGLSAANRDLLVKTADAKAPQGWAAMDDTTRATIDDYQKSGVTLVRIDGIAGGRQAWDEALRPVRDKWVADMESKGLPGKAVLQAWDEALKAAR